MVSIMVSTAHNDEESKEKWTRITLRLPSHLHKMLTESAGPMSLNAAIVQRLNDTFGHTDRLPNYEEMRKAILKDLRQEMREMLDDIRRKEWEEDQRS